MVGMTNFPFSACTHSHYDHAIYMPWPKFLYTKLIERVRFILNPGIGPLTRLTRLFQTYKWTGLYTWKELKKNRTNLDPARPRRSSKKNKTNPGHYGYAHERPAYPFTQTLVFTFVDFTPRDVYRQTYSLALHHS